MFLLCGCGGLRGERDELRGFHPLLPCQALGQALVLSRQGRGGVGCVGLLYARPGTSPLDCGSSPQ